MNYKLLIKFLGLVLLIEAGLLVFPLIAALVFKPADRIRQHAGMRVHQARRLKAMR